MPAYHKFPRRVRGERARDVTGLEDTVTTARNAYDMSRLPSVRFRFKVKQYSPLEGEDSRDQEEKSEREKIDGS